MCRVTGGPRATFGKKRKEERKKEIWRRSEKPGPHKLGFQPR